MNKLIIITLLIISAAMLCGNTPKTPTIVPVTQNIIVEADRFTRENEPMAVSRGNVERRIAVVTAYTCNPKECGKEVWEDDYGVTASGRKLTQKNAWKVCAADPRVHPMGSKIYIDGVGELTVVDTGSAIKGERIDIFVGMGENKRDIAVANAWGVCRVGVARI